MSNDSIEVIILRLQHMEDLLEQIHEEVKRTNGRVTSLELEKARTEGDRRSRQTHQMIATSVISGCFLAGIIWFVTQAI